MRKKALGALLPLVVVLSAACDGGQRSGTGDGRGLDLAGPHPLPRGSEPVNLDPADFGGPIDNEWWPMAVGSRWVYRESAPDGTEQKVVVTVTDETREIQGIEATVVHDVVSEDGEVTEDTFDWYAQDRWGNVWYMGEDTKEFENGKVVTTAGSWESGVDGAQAGIIMPANPQPGMVYQQEYYEGEAEDVGEVLSLHEMAQVPYGFFRNALLTKDTTPLEPRVQEYKLYAKGIGPVLVLGVSGGADREDLISFQEG